MKLNPAKSTFFVKEITVLGFTDGARDAEEAVIWPEDRKICVIRNYPVPRSYKEVEKFVYLTPFLRRWIPGRADHAKTMKDCLKEDGKGGKYFVWGPKQQASFQAIKDSVVTNTVHGVDPSLQIHVVTDASETGLGAVVFQLTDHPPNTKLTPTNRKNMRIVAYISQQFTPAERKYTNSKREALAVIKVLEDVRYMILGGPYPIIVYTDHSALTTLLVGDSAKGRIANWQHRLAEFELRFVHIPAKQLEIADGLSRIPAHVMAEPKPLDDQDDHPAACQILPWDPLDPEVQDERGVGQAEKREEWQQEEGWLQRVLEVLGKKERKDDKAEGMNEKLQQMARDALILVQSSGEGEAEEEQMVNLREEIGNPAIPENVPLQSLHRMDEAALSDFTENMVRDAQEELKRWKKWIDSDWYGDLIHYQIMGRVKDGPLSKDGRRKRWVKANVGRFALTTIYGGNDVLSRLESRE